MQAIQYAPRILGRPLPRSTVGVLRDAGSVVDKLYPPLLWSGLLLTALENVPPPRLPGPDWVKIKTRLGGICGSDLSAIHSEVGPSYLTAFSSFPFTFGHENLGYIAEVGPAVQGWRVGERVVAEPTLWCRPRGFEQLCPYCARGETNRCERMALGTLAPGISIGYCRDTGGSWGEYFVAHESQLYRVPETVGDESAVLVEPFAASLHAVLGNLPGDDQTVLIIGAGAVGLLTLAALRAAGSSARILVLARHRFQAEAARRIGASEVLEGRADHHSAIADLTGAVLRHPFVGRPVLVGGVERTFDCVGSEQTLNDSLRLTRAGGRITLLGFPVAARNVDWDALSLKELKLEASYVYNHAEQWEGQTTSTFALALELLEQRRVDIGWLVTHRFSLRDYGRAFAMLNRRGGHGIFRAVFEFAR